MRVPVPWEQGGARHDTSKARKTQAHVFGSLCAAGWRRARYFCKGNSMKTIFACLVSFAVMTTCAFAQNVQEPPSINTQGDATVRQAADLAWVQIAVEARGAKPEDARRQAATAMTSVMTALRRSVSSDDIKTASFSLEPEMDFSNNRQQIRGYIARNRLEVRVSDLEKLPAVLDASVAGGATSIAGLRFDTQKRETLELQALQTAVEDAMARAEAIARGAKRSLGPIIRISEQRMSAQPMFRTLAADSGIAQSRAETPITPGEVEIRAQVSLTVGIR